MISADPGTIIISDFSGLLGQKIKSERLEKKSLIMKNSAEII